MSHLRRLLVAVLVAASGCTSDLAVEPAPPTPGPAPEGTIRVGYPTEPPTLDPVAVGGGSAATRDLLRPVLPALFRLGDDLRPEPELAAAWPVPEEITFDPFSVRLRLRTARWSDGTPITAEDVRFSWERLREGPTGARYRPLSDVEVAGPRELRLVFDRPVRRWWALFSVDDMVLPAHAYDEGWGTGGPTVAGGPFAFEGRVPGLSVRLRRNDAYWGEPAAAAAVEVVVVPDDETRLNLVERGELDVAFAEGEANWGYRAAVRGLEIVDGAVAAGGGTSGAWASGWWELAMHPDRVRERPAVAGALALAVERDLAAEILEDSGQVLRGMPSWFPVDPPREEGRPGIPGPWPEADADRARRILREAGFRLEGDDLVDGEGQLVELLVAVEEGSGGARALGGLLHYRMRPLGIRVEIVSVRTDVFHREWLPEGRADAVLRLVRGSDAPDPWRYVEGPGPYGTAPVIEDDVLTAISATSRARLAREPVVGLAAGAWLRAQEALVSTRVVMPLVRTRTWLVARPDVEGPHALGTAAGPLWNAGMWRVRTTA